ncbi:MAG: right-handed parallel beta-helix repeat-containing protein, partial [Clostridia bacterium]|nr:right-handed parallel beta-helix repeat-containing protein [Clostridia bacterium]
SADLSFPEMWEEESENIWVTRAVRDDEVCNIIFNGTANECGTLRWTKEDLCSQGDFHDNCFGFSSAGKPIKNHEIRMYSSKNPALYYTSVQAALFGERFVISLSDNIVIENITVRNSGVHAIAGYFGGKNVKIRNCDFICIGGAVWNYERRIRFGNGIEFWNAAENVEISLCHFDNIYDSAVTHQGPHDTCAPAKNFIIDSNVFIRCGMAAYEQRDRMPEYAEFKFNLCLEAGEGFSKLGEVMPRRSEIWPQPMGHHLFLWRIEEPSCREGKLIVEWNNFDNAPYGAAFYSIIDGEAESQITMSNNSYFTKNPNLIARFGGIDYKTFEEYRDNKEPSSRWHGDCFYWLITGNKE